MAPTSVGLQPPHSRVFFLFVMTFFNSLVLLSHSIHLDEDHVTGLELGLDLFLVHASSIFLLEHYKRDILNLWIAFY